MCQSATRSHWRLQCVWSCWLLRHRECPRACQTGGSALRNESSQEEREDK
ncbi:hypothetical protein GBAR_LOCUS25320 [Geodia barretti]|uniref:Uncharacterized protein n=1 Tax=Geodia barretti TaxID=519541 RepID=A0AA35TD61_GEOBA|nr:hypothetical protein GBAR_LOCUS25320 [Geodia barretti]